MEHPSALPRPSAISRKAALWLAVAAALTPIGSANARPASYSLEADKSTVAFFWDFGKDEVQGKMPVSRADLTLDFDNITASEIAVALDVVRAVAGFPFANQAMVGPKVLDAARFPEIGFQSTRVTAEGDGANIQGQITIRGVTRPIALHAVLYRQRGTEVGDRSHLSVLLTGTVNRSEFGASGWSDVVGDEVRLKILARIARDD